MSAAWQRTPAGWQCLIPGVAPILDADHVKQPAIRSLATLAYSTKAPGIKST
jgi:hypothetical protein